MERVPFFLFPILDFLKEIKMRHKKPLVGKKKGMLLRFVSRSLKQPHKHYAFSGCAAKAARRSHCSSLSSSCCCSSYYYSSRRSATTTRCHATTRAKDDDDENDDENVPLFVAFARSLSATQRKRPLLPRRHTSADRRRAKKVPVLRRRRRKLLLLVEAPTNPLFGEEEDERERTTFWWQVWRLCAISWVFFFSIIYESTFYGVKREGKNEGKNNNGRKKKGHVKCS